MSPDQAEALIAEHFDCSDGPALSIGPTGEEYVAIISSGRWDGETSVNALYRTPELAAEAWHQAICRYAAEAVGIEAVGFAEAKTMFASTSRHKLYWRIRPEMNEMEICWRDRITENGEMRPETWYSVYSRLLISDKPVIGAKEAA